MNKIVSCFMIGSYLISSILFFSGNCIGGEDAEYNFRPRVLYLGLGVDVFSLPQDVDRVQYDDCEIDEFIREVLDSYEPAGIRRVFPDFDPANYLEFDDVPPLDRFFALSFDNDINVPSLADHLSRLRGVLYAEPSYFRVNPDTSRISVQGQGQRGGAFPELEKSNPFIPNDPVFNSGTWLQQYNLQKGNIGIDCPTAWAFTKGDSDVRIGNLDFGIWWDHEDLDIAGGFRIEENEWNGSFYPGQPVEYFSEHMSHGTLSAGVLGAITNNGLGVAGIAGGDGTTEGCPVYDLQLKIEDLGSENMEAWACAVFSAADPLGEFHCNVISISLGSSTPGNNNTFRAAIRFANSVGVNVVAGNGRIIGGPQYPALFQDNWITAVGAFDDDAIGLVHWNSGRGGKIDLIGPGGECPSTTAPFLSVYDPAYSDSNGLMYLGYHVLSSCATPHVAGSIALLRSFLGNQFSPFDFENILKLSANDSISDNNAQTWNADYGHGKLNVGQALTNASQCDIIKFSTNLTKIESSELVVINFISGPYVGIQNAYKYKISGEIGFNGSFSNVPKVWGSAEPAYFFGFHGLSDYSPNFGESWHGVEESSISVSGCKAFTYTYLIEDGTGKFTNWYPANPNQIPVSVKAMGLPASPKLILNVKKNDLEMKNAPNPFNSNIEISVKIDTPGHLEICVIDIRGRIVCTLLNDNWEANSANVLWDGKDNSGKAAPSGVYFVRAVSESATLVEKIVLAK